MKKNYTEFVYIGHTSQINEAGENLVPAKKEPPFDYWHFNAITEFRFKNQTD